MRSSALEVMGQDYIRTCKAKGMPRYILLYRHMLKNAILPVLTILGPTTASILMGGLVIEKIFAIPGLGQHLINGIFNRDYTVIMGLTVFYAFLLITATLLVDISYCLIDPRISLAGGTKDE
jgi:ABC-type dipeptide/oligopeptide/nickel transport system permease component